MANIMRFISLLPIFQGETDFRRIARRSTLRYLGYQADGQQAIELSNICTG